MYLPHKILSTCCLAVISLCLAVGNTYAEVATEPQSAAERLQPLEWLIGEWTGTTESGIVLVSSQWSDGGNYIVREFLVRNDDGDEVGGSQRIGWDPLKGELKSWSFDSQGGYGEGHWRRDGKNWVVESTEVTADGQQSKASATYTPGDADSFVWEVKSAQLPGVSLPGQQIKFQRAKDDE